MKKSIFFTMLLATFFAFSSCEEHPDGPQTEEPTTFDILHTTWQGTYNGTVQHPQAGTLPCLLTWTLDFVDESNISILLEMSINGQAQQPQDLSCTYTYSGLQGEIVNEEEGNVQRNPFVVDPINRTFTIDFRITTGFSQEEPQVVGGPTVFHQIH